MKEDTDRRNERDMDEKIIKRGEERENKENQ